MGYAAPGGGRFARRARDQGLSIANVVEGVLKLLSGHGRAIAPILPAGNNLSEVVVGVNPARAVGIGDGRALVGGVLLVIEAHRRIRRLVLDFLIEIRKPRS